MGDSELVYGALHPGGPLRHATGHLAPLADRPDDRSGRFVLARERSGGTEVAVAVRDASSDPFLSVAN
ncbi:hypothetical protein [Natrinema versiforme]|uniref:Uncharacterized protein n=1 Tax=Natrinema versiforme JCM 10478 TaxID=1227496 RepID=L9XP12_9EURY|nr:hypothetical protein [Natrinema versiforme]ELY63297.1 hypothetical protein C489_19566 [Natrinema versiforme JCM 10478]